MSGRVGFVCGLVTSGLIDDAGRRVDVGRPVDVCSVSGSVIETEFGLSVATVEENTSS